MSKEYELAFRMNAELDAKFSRVFTTAHDKIGDLERKLRSIDQQGRGGGGFGKGIISGLTSMSRAAGLAAGVAVAGGVMAAGYAVKDSIGKAMDFEAQMSTIQALTGASSQELSKLQALALKMGASTKYNAMEAAQGIEELLKAGLTPAAVQAGGLEAALNLATAGGLELADAAEIMSTALNAYKRDGMSAADASNILAGTANASATSVEELRYSLAAVSAVAAGAGMSFQDTSTALGLFANNGLKGSDAGTSLKTMLMNLIPQTKEEAKLFKKLGVTAADGANSFFDAAGNIKDLAGIADILQKKLKHLTREQRLSTLENMFGSDAIRAANILYEEGAAGVEKFRKEMSKVTALDVARKKMDNAAGAVEQFKGAIETLQISALLPTMPIIKDLALAAADFTEKYTPQITASVQRAVDGARSYFKKRFIENPEFQKIPTLEGKIDYVFNSVMETFNSWWGTTGSKEFEGVSNRVASFLVSTLESTVPELTTIGVKMGNSLGTGIWDALKESKVGWLVKGTDWTVDKLKPNRALTPKFVEDIWESAGINLYGDKPKDNYTPKTQYNTDPFERFSSNKKLFDKPKNQQIISPTFRAVGGYVNKPELAWIGEGRSPEWVIPDNKAPRSQALLQAANQSMGNPTAGTGDFVYSPTYIIQGNADRAAINDLEQRQKVDFAQEFEAYKRQKERVSVR